MRHPVAEIRTYCRLKRKVIFGTLLSLLVVIIGSFIPAYLSTWPKLPDSTLHDDERCIQAFLIITTRNWRAYFRGKNIGHDVAEYFVNHSAASPAFRTLSSEARVSRELVGISARNKIRSRVYPLRYPCKRIYFWNIAILPAAFHGWSWGYSRLNKFCRLSDITRLGQATLKLLFVRYIRRCI